MAFFASKWVEKIANNISLKTAALSLTQIQMSPLDNEMD